jgi:hypothetical protein
MVGVNLGATVYTEATTASIADVTSATGALTKVKAAIDQLATDRATVEQIMLGSNIQVNRLAYLILI